MTNQRGILFYVLIIWQHAVAQEIQAPPDSVLVLSTDTIIQKDTNQAVLDAPILYQAKDSLVFDVKKQVLFLYGKASINYKNTNLESGLINLDLANKNLSAKGWTDTSFSYIDRPYFKDGEQGFYSDSMKYNFDTEKGKIYRAKTKEGDGYIHGKEIKKIDDQVIFIKNGKYTTCQHDTPHFCIEAKKLKIIKNDKIVTGPANIKVQESPTPLWLPFGFFPNNQKQSSGLVLPNGYGVSPQQGAFLQKIGYFWGGSQYVNTEFLFDIYSLGSWAIYQNTQYKKRYQFDGGFNISYYVFKQGLQELPSYSEQRNFLVKWNHKQIVKSPRKWNFSSDVTAGSNSVYQNNITTTTDNYLNNTFRSNIALSKNIHFGNTPAAFSMNASHEQNVRDSSIVVNLPTLNLNVSRFFPLKPKKAIIKKWYHDIGMSYSASAQNQVRTKLDSSFFTSRTLSLLDNGFQHVIPINTSFKWKNFVTVNPGLEYRGVGYLKQLEKKWDVVENKLNTDTLPRASMFHTASANVSLTSKMYGMYTFSPESRIKAIRHVITPTINATYAPDMSMYWGKNYFGEYIQYTNTGNPFDTISYAKIAGLYGSPSQQNTGAINFSLMNDVEMKYTSQDSSKTEKKMKLLDNFFMSSGYIFTLDSFQLQPIAFRGNFNLIKNLSINFTGTMDPYRLDPISGRRINYFEWEKWSEQTRVARLTNLTTSLAYSLRGKSTASQKSKNTGTTEENQDIQDNPHLYVDFNIPWNLSVSYNFYYTKPLYEKNITQSIYFNGDIKLTPRWKIGFSSSYDLALKKLALPTLNLYRDLHCWELNFRVIPAGNRQSYNFTMNAKAPVLQDLKLNRKLEWYDR